MKKQTINIYEVKNGWLNGTWGHHYKTATGALKAVKNDDKKKGNCITIINWYPRTRTGEKIIKAIQ